ncbi:unnamed protein product [Polarella glacialis]|uniref:C3H1-type domain-containing protein n=1 Tax=Polarella glacialis TaxID=89957 RepID=A0A813F579_POLGL|nr:unnamed protein product [Polarella glacialis]CAE8655709.1 unnamed protein product [Polarella glacialis]
MQCIQVKNTFIHFHLASDEVEGVLRRSSSSPAIMKTPWMEEPTRQAAEAWPVTEDEREWTEDEARTEASAEASTEASADTSPVKSCVLEEKLLAHRLGKCKPCGYLCFKVDGCRQGADCEFCHFCSLDDVKDRKRSGKRQARAFKRAAGYMAPFQPRSDSSRFSRPSIPTWHWPGAIPRSAPLAQSCW